jgi:hypothetical protein
MSRIEGTVWRPLAAVNTQPKMAKHDLIILHTMVGYLSSTDAMFRQGGFSGVESHFGVGGKWGGDKAKDLDGVVYQWGDTDRTADANLQANPRAISIETADNAPKSASDLAPWTDAQCAAIIDLVAALCKEHDIPARLVDNSRPSQRGIAYHRQGIDPWRVSGGETWSNSRGKECPGDARIGQIHSVILPGVKDVLAGRITEEDDMKPTDRHTLTEADAAAFGDPSLEGETKSYDELWRFPPATARLRREQDEDTKALAAKIDELNAKLSAVLAAVKK